MFSYDFFLKTNMMIMGIIDMDHNFSSVVRFWASSTVPRSIFSRFSLDLIPELSRSPTLHYSIDLFWYRHWLCALEFGLISFSVLPSRRVPLFCRRKLALSIRWCSRAWERGCRWPGHRRIFRVFGSRHIGSEGWPCIQGCPRTLLRVLSTLHTLIELLLPWLLWSKQQPDLSSSSRCLSTAFSWWNSKSPSDLCLQNWRSIPFWFLPQLRLFIQVLHEL